MHLKKRNFLILAFLLSLSISIILSNIIHAQIQNSKDVIAIRVIPNPTRISALRWYKEQNFNGSPQSLIIDGYRAIREGRTVYVNVANVANDVLYTNIYLISYNQEAEQETTDIFAQILNHWKFNINLDELGFCDKNIERNCFVDSECEFGSFCQSDKAKTVRDTIRMEDLADLRTAIENYQDITSYYPNLKAGTYIPNTTISSWPSWQDVLASILDYQTPLDPINALGDCGDLRFNSVTCWDEKEHEFADPINDTKLDLPLNSHVYYYSDDPQGASYEICAIMESGFVVAEGDGFCLDNETSNETPEAIDSFLPDGMSGEPYSGFVVIGDSSENNLSWTINAEPISQWDTWSAIPSIENISGFENQKNITADQAGKDGVYALTLVVDDGRGMENSILERTYNIVIHNDPPLILVQNISYTASTTDPLNYSFRVNDAPSNYPLTYTLLPNNIPAGLITNFDFDAANNDYIFSVAGIIDPNLNPVPITTDYTSSINVGDLYGGTGTGIFTITVINNSPVIDLSDCIASIRNGTFYSCNISASDPDEHDIVSITLNESTKPSWMSIDANGEISGTANSLDTFNIGIRAEDEYGAINSPESLNLNILSYCGDGVAQDPNTEERGGPLDDGYENCDGTSGVAINVAQSSSDRMYACTESCPLTGTCFNTCEYTGGFCGDGLIQDESEILTDSEECDFVSDINCCTDCKWACPDLVHSTAILNFPNGESANFSSGDTAIFDIPSCRSLISLSANLEKTISYKRAAIVFVTDTSGSMPNGMDEVRSALLESLTALHEASLGEAELHIGLVRFSSSISSMSIKDASIVAEINNFKNSVSAYTDTGGTYTNEAIIRAQTMLNDYTAERKIIILLSDGDPNLGHDPLSTINVAKAAGTIFYTITYYTGDPDPSLESTMCQWSNDNGGLSYPCYSDHYSYSSSNASGPYESIREDILSTPGDIVINIQDTNTTVSFMSETIDNVPLNLPDITCSESRQDIPMTITFSEEGGMSISNLELEYCPSCDLGTTFCGDGTAQYPNSNSFFEECDGIDLNGKTCEDLNFGGGTLSCAAGCTFNEDSCCEAIYGGWSEWSEWSECSGGKEERTRVCDEPEPSCGGPSCEGDNYEIRDCCISNTCEDNECGLINDICNEEALDCGACSGTAICFESYCSCTGLQSYCSGFGCVDLESDSDNCGDCNNSCGANASCTAGACSCSAGYDDCNSDWSDGCEVDLNSDDDNCNACGDSCGANASCTAGACSCAAGYDDCNSDWSDGCEVDLNSDDDNCNACGDSCGANASCTAGACSCDAGYDDCDGDSDCECDTSTNSCVGGVCT